MTIENLSTAESRDNFFSQLLKEATSVEKVTKLFSLLEAWANSRYIISQEILILLAFTPWLTSCNNLALLEIVFLVRLTVPVLLITILVRPHVLSSACDMQAHTCTCMHATIRNIIILTARTLYSSVPTQSWVDLLVTAAEMSAAVGIVPVIRAGLTNIPPQVHFG